MIGSSVHTQLKAAASERWPSNRLLVIAEEGSTTKQAIDLLKQVVPKDARFMKVVGDWHDLTTSVVRAAREGTWLVAEIEGDLTSDAVAMIKEIGQYHGTVRDRRGTSIPLPDTFRFVGVIKQEAIEHQSYPGFLNLFDGAFRVTA